MGVNVYSQLSHILDNIEGCSITTHCFPLVARCLGRDGGREEEVTSTVSLNLAATTQRQSFSVPFEERRGSRPVRRPMVNKTSISAFGGSIILVFIFTTIALFTPGWRYFRNGGPQLGLVTYHCGSGIREVNFRDCKDWYNARWIFERAALAFMILAFLFEIAAIGIFVILFIKANRVIGGAAAIVSLLICASLFIAILVYGVNFQSKPVYIRSNTNEMNGNSILGYAYWLALTAFILSIIPLVSSGAIPSSIPSSNPHNSH